MKIDNRSLYLLSEVINIFDVQIDYINKRPKDLLLSWTSNTEHELDYLNPTEFEKNTGISIIKIIDDAMGVKYVYLKNYLQLFRNIVSYITHLNRIGLESKQHIHLLPNLRALLEIVGNSLYTLNGDQQQAISIAFTRQIFTISNLLNVNATQTDQSDELIIQYQNWYDLNIDLINFLKIPVPRDPLLFDYKYQNKHIKFPSMYEMLNPEWIKESAPETMNIFKTIHENLYGLYSNLSNYVHGNSLLNSAYGRESYWVLSHTLILSSLFVEITDSKLLENLNIKRIEEWRVMLKEELPYMTKAWSATKTNIK